jgi:hypothetical protein
MTRGHVAASGGILQLVHETSDELAGLPPTINSASIAVKGADRTMASKRKVPTVDADRMNIAPDADVALRREGGGQRDEPGAGGDGSPTSRIERIARRAYEISQSRGGNDGRALDDWLQAEREIDGE